jgi:hypothetical protein
LTNTRAAVGRARNCRSDHRLAGRRDPHGQVFTGATTINLSGGGATISNCPGTSSTAVRTTGWVKTSLYCRLRGDGYVHGAYSQPLNIVSEHDIVIVAFELLIQGLVWGRGPRRGRTTTTEPVGLITAGRRRVRSTQARLGLLK